MCHLPVIRVGINHTISLLIHHVQKWVADVDFRLLTSAHDQCHCMIFCHYALDTTLLGGEVTQSNSVSNLDFALQHLGTQTISLFILTTQFSRWMPSTDTLLPEFIWHSEIFGICTNKQVTAGWTINTVGEPIGQSDAHWQHASLILNTLVRVVQMAYHQIHIYGRPSEPHLAEYRWCRKQSCSHKWANQKQL